MRLIFARTCFGDSFSSARTGLRSETSPVPALHARAPTSPSPHRDPPRARISADLLFPLRLLFPKPQDSPTLPLGAHDSYARGRDMRRGGCTRGRWRHLAHCARRLSCLPLRRFACWGHVTARGGEIPRSYTSAHRAAAHSLVVIILTPARTTLRPPSAYRRRLRSVGMPSAPRDWELSADPALSQTSRRDSLLRMVNTQSIAISSLYSFSGARAYMYSFKPVLCVGGREGVASVLYHSSCPNQH
jgi:hypothetical protein